METGVLTINMGRWDSQQARLDGNPRDILRLIRVTYASTIPQPNCVKEGICVLRFPPERLGESLWPGMQ